LVGLHFRTKLGEFRRQREVREKYYRNRHFRNVDQILLSTYRFSNPYSIVKQHLEERGESDVHCYGETPLSTYDQIAKACNLSETDKFLELGCGRGRGCFFISHFYHCPVMGIDCIPDFIDTAIAIMDGFHMPRLEFRCEDMFTADFRGATCIYLYGTCLKDFQVDQLAKRFAELPKGIRIVTVSYPLSDYVPSITIEKKLECVYPWGKTEVYINRV
jgi:SAM-dependent methyltransferase